MTKTLDELRAMIREYGDCRSQHLTKLATEKDDAIESALRELIADVERYRWWREQWCQKDPVMPDALVHAFTAPELDAAIDAARKG